MEDIDYHNRVDDMMNILPSKDSRVNESVEGFGQMIDQLPATAYAIGDCRGIPGDGTRNQPILVKPLSGLFNQSK